MTQLRLSASRLQLLRGPNPCPRCFHDYDKHGRPRGAFPTMPGGVDRALKEYVDGFRTMPVASGGFETSLPPELVGHVRGARLWGSRPDINRIRNWKGGLSGTYKTAEIIGALDDLLVSDDGHSPLDVKTKGKRPDDAGLQWYGSAMDLYAWLLKANSMQPSGRAYLWYWWPVVSPHAPGQGVLVRFDQCVFEVEADWRRAEKLVDEALAVLAGPQPGFTNGCEYCDYRRA